MWKWDYMGETMWEVGISGYKNVASGTIEVKNVGSGTIGVQKCGKWDFHFNVGLVIFVEINCVSHIKWFC